MMRNCCLLGGLLLALPGCAGRAAYYLVDATRTYQEAADAGAAEGAVYEFTLAGEYLRKAREEDGYADYDAAEKLARRATQEAIKAKAVAAEAEIPAANTKGVPDDAKPKEPEPVDTSPMPVIDP
jgi:hypothetical protein